ncbi:MAG TPA: peptide deformylase [Desulfobacterales bacterium]|nr:peptide deformylase [Desulfobacterales bacterium]
MSTPLEILTYPDRFLLKPTQPVKSINGALQDQIDRMAETMYAAPGIGLAAIQVGIDQSFLVYDIALQAGERALQVLINPRIVTKEGEVLSENEGCLSVPDFRADVLRARTVFVKGYDREGKEVEIEASGFQAIVLQHEIDHLDGTLFIEHISSLKRQLYKRRIKKQIKLA